MTRKKHFHALRLLAALCVGIALSSAEPAHAQGKIAFGSDRSSGDYDVYIMNPDGSGVTQLTTDPARDNQPSFSPDGSKILFYSHRDGSTSEIYVMNSDGSAQTRLTNSPGNDFHPSFSPDGTRIAFHSNRDGDFEIFVMNADGSEPTQVTQNSAFDTGASYSPDGSRIVFTSNRDPGGLTGNYEIYVMNADGRDQTRLTNNPAFDSGAEFSPDGTKIVFYSDRDGDHEIYLMNADGSDVTQLTAAAGRDADPAFSPDGSRIVFTSNRDGNEEIYVMNIDGSGQTRLTSNLASDIGAGWGRFEAPLRVLNLSTRARVGSGDEVLIGGLIITGNQPKRVIFRAIGPSLQQDGAALSGRLSDPTLSLRDANGVEIAFNDDWQQAAERTEIEQSGVAPTDEREATILRTLAPGAYTAVLRGSNDSTGLAVVELYDLNSEADSRLANLSTRGFVQTDPDLLIGGFITSGPTEVVVVRGLGPSLGQSGVPTPLADPLLSIHDANGAQIASNDDWQDDPNSAAIQSYGLAPRDSKEAALLIMPPAGATTAVLRGRNNTTGNALMEIYDVTPQTTADTAVAAQE